MSCGREIKNKCSELTEYNRDAPFSHNSAALLQGFKSRGNSQTL